MLWNDGFACVWTSCADAEVGPRTLRGLLPRLERFLEPFVATLHTPEQRAHAQHYAAGLVSDLTHKTAEGIASLRDQECQGLQKFLGQTGVVSPMPGLRSFFGVGVGQLIGSYDLDLTLSLYCPLIDLRPDAAQQDHP
jgi:hypothetical protein